MKGIILLSATTFFLTCLVNSVVAEMMVFPAKGQSNEQLEKDKFACYSWGKEQSGFDPMASPPTAAPVPAPPKKTGGVLKGGLGGAALGAIIGDSSKATKRGAAAGALIGGVRQHSANSKSARASQQQQQSQSNAYAANRSKYNRAYAACLEGKGYSVK